MRSAGWKRKRSAWGYPEQAALRIQGVQQWYEVVLAGAASMEQYECTLWLSVS
jgi:uncharacterized membrane protein YoaT (DUF817 family)